MNRYILTLLVLVFTTTFNAQIVVSETLNGPSIDGTEIELQGDPSDIDIEHTLYVRNEGAEALGMKVRRLETDVTSDTYNNICWLICPATPQYAGDNPDWLTNFTVTIPPMGVDSSFAIHYNPNGNTGCSLFDVRWVNPDNENEVFGQVYFRMVHGNEDCQTVGLEELSLESLQIAPNPSNDQTVLSIDEGIGTVQVQVMDLLGQVVMDEFWNSQNGRLEIGTANLNEGLYFISIAQDQKVLKTMKLVVRH